MNNTHVIIPGSYRAAAAGAVRVGDVDPDRVIELVLDLRSQAALPEGHVASTWTPEKLEAAYAADAASIQTVKTVLAGYQLAVEGQSKYTPSLYVKGRAADVELAFRAGLSMYRGVGQGNYVGRREGTYSVPKQLAGLVLGVHGLDERRVLRRFPGKRTEAAAATAAAIPGLSPSALEQRYTFPAGTGAGQLIAIAEFGGAVFQDDLAQYTQEFGLPPQHVEIKTLGVKQQPTDLDTSAEVNMDVQIVAGLCPAASITVYFAKFSQDGFLRLIDAVIAQRPVALSVSYGACEDDKRSWSPTALAAINRRLNAARLVGITVCVSTGDDGTGCDMFDGGVHVEFPSSSPYVLAVGGTMVKNNTEVTWWDAPGTRFEPNTQGQTGGGSTGGGVSDRFPQPDWQTVQVKTLNSAGGSGRILPDVAALAGEPGSACLLRFQQQDGSVSRGWVPGMGTSASTPILASLLTRINAELPVAKRQRFLGSLLYQPLPGGGTLGAAAFTPITSGSNESQPDPGIGYAAGAGFSAVTGWGVPNGQNLLTELAKM